MKEQARKNNEDKVKQKAGKKARKNKEQSRADNERIRNHVVSVATRRRQVRKDGVLVTRVV
jgi:hypothetical protein